MSQSVDPRGGKRYGPYEFRLGDELRGERATLGRSLLDIQRDLRIKAAYIAAIENADPSVFPNPSFIAGYVRSYARYLGLDPDEVFWRFCDESGFAGARLAPETPAPARRGRRRAVQPTGRRPAAGEFFPAFPLAEAAPRRLPAVPVGALGSLLVLVLLIGGLGYGGWAILQNIQRVQFAPVDEVPVVLAELPALEPPVAEAAEPVLPELAAPVAATALVDLYRQQELEVPILLPRDGPIAAIDPDRTGPLAQAVAPRVAAEATPGIVVPSVAGAEVELAAAEGEPLAEAPEEVGDDGRARLLVIAERPAWIRVYFAGGTIIFERILESGEIYDVPPTAEAPLIWAGNSGSVYVKVGAVIHGPLGRGTRAVRDVLLEPAAVAERFPEVDEIPTVISETISNLAQNTGVLRQ